MYTKKFKSHFSEFKCDRERNVLLCVSGVDENNRKIDVYTLQYLNDKILKPKFSCIVTIINKKN